MVKKIVLFGASGRVGSSIAAQMGSIAFTAAAREDDLLQLVSDARDTVLLVFSIPHLAVKERLAELEARLEELVCGDIIVLDCSGHVKQSIQDHWHILDGASWAQYLSARTLQRHRVHYIGNPGCMASTVIQAVRASGLSFTNSELSVTAVGGRSYGPATPAATETCHSQLRVARNWLTHHHVSEIERSLATQGPAKVVSFMPLICSSLEHGLMITVSWRSEGCAEAVKVDDVPGVTRCDQDLDVATVLGSPMLAMRTQTTPSVSGGVTISVAAAIDNIDHVAMLAVASIRQVLES